MNCEFQHDFHYFWNREQCSFNESEGYRLCPFSPCLRDFPILLSPQIPPPNGNLEDSPTRLVWALVVWMLEKDQVRLGRKMLKVDCRLNVTCYTIGKVFL